MTGVELEERVTVLEENGGGGNTVNGKLRPSICSETKSHKTVTKAHLYYNESERSVNCIGFIAAAIKIKEKNRLCSSISVNEPYRATVVLTLH